jgi:hypothetical protein
MERREVQPPDMPQDLAAIGKRLLDLERQVSAFRVPKIQDDLLDTEVLYQAPTSPGGPTPPGNGDVLTFDTTRDSPYGGLWVPGSAPGVGPVVCHTYTSTGDHTWTDDEIFDDVPRDNLWLISVMALGGLGVTGREVYVDVYDDGYYYVAADRTVSGDYTSRDYASVSFPWWPPPEGNHLRVIVGAHDSSGTGLDFSVQIRAVRLGPVPDCVCFVPSED